MEKIFNTNETGLNHPLVIRAISNKPKNMPKDALIFVKKTYQALLRNNGNWLMFYILKDNNKQLSILYPNGNISYGGETKLLPAIKYAIKNAIYYI
jgi:hypothetical protein